VTTPGRDGWLHPVRGRSRAASVLASYLLLRCLSTLAVRMRGSIDPTHWPTIPTEPVCTIPGASNRYSTRRCAAAALW
jgi:hypothetical protein